MRVRPLNKQEMTPTKAIYHDHGELRTLITKVNAVEPLSALSEADRALFKQNTPDDPWVLTTAATIFYAQGGGQPSDTGTICLQKSPGGASFEVSSVRNTSGGDILHLGQFVPQDSSPFTTGDEVNQIIDDEKRNLHSRLHTAGHVLALAVHQLADHIHNVTELKASHYPNAAFVEFRGLIDGKHKEALQAACNKFVQQALPVKICKYSEPEMRDKCSYVPDDFVIPDGEKVRVVEIVGAGACPCGGTHVLDTSQIESMQVRRISRQKGVSKISYSVT